jgi:hypothetical protein
MLVLCRSSRQVVVANKQLEGTDMVGEHDMECTTLAEARARHLGQRHDRRCDAARAVWRPEVHVEPADERV